MNGKRIINNIYMGYTYRGTIRIPKGHLEIDLDLPFPTCQFYEEETGKRHCRLPQRQYYMYYGRVWGEDKDRVRDIIIARYKERIKELENSNALAYAEMIVDGV